MPEGCQPRGSRIRGDGNTENRAPPPAVRNNLFISGASNSHTLLHTQRKISAGTYRISYRPYLRKHSVGTRPVLVRPKTGTHLYFPVRVPLVTVLRTGTNLPRPRRYQHRRCSDPERFSISSSTRTCGPLFAAWSMMKHTLSSVKAHFWEQREHDQPRKLWICLQTKKKEVI